MSRFLNIFFCLAAINCYAQQQVINGYAPCLKDGTTLTIQLLTPRRISNLGNNITTTTVSGGRFSFTINQDGGERYFMFFNKNHADIFLGPGKTTINILDTTLKVSVTGNICASEYKAYNDTVRSNNKYKAFYAASLAMQKLARNKAIDRASLNKQQQLIDSLKNVFEQETVSLTIAWVKSHPQSYLNTYLLTYFVIGLIPDGDFSTLFNNLPLNIKQNSWGKELKYRVDSLLTGGTAPNFIEPDTNGRYVKLSDFKGRYVLVDFWASWCGPCRKDNPNVVKAWQMFKGRKFTIVSVSLDEKKQDWIKAINDDGMPWINTSELNGWKNHVSGQYYVYSIPSNFLVNPQGVIVARNLRGDELISTLSTLIK